MSSTFLKVEDSLEAMKTGWLAFLDVWQTGSDVGGFCLLLFAYCFKVCQSKTMKRIL